MAIRKAAEKRDTLPPEHLVRDPGEPIELRSWSIWRADIMMELQASGAVVGSQMQGNIAGWVTRIVMEGELVTIDISPDLKGNDPPRQVMLHSASGYGVRAFPGEVARMLEGARGLR